MEWNMWNKAVMQKTRFYNLPIGMEWNGIKSVKIRNCIFQNGMEWNKKARAFARAFSNIRWRNTTY